MSSNVRTVRARGWVGWLILLGLMILACLSTTGSVYGQVSTTAVNRTYEYSSPPVSWGQNSAQTPVLASPSPNTGRPSSYTIPFHYNNDPTLLDVQVTIDLDTRWDESSCSDGINYQVEKKADQDGNVSESFEVEVSGSRLTISPNEKTWMSGLIVISAWCTEEGQTSAVTEEVTIHLERRHPSLTTKTIEDISLFPGFQTKIIDVADSYESNDGSWLQFLADSSNENVIASFENQSPRYLQIMVNPTAQPDETATITIKPDRPEWANITTTFTVTVVDTATQASTFPSFSSTIKAAYNPNPTSEDQTSGALYEWEQGVAIVPINHPRGDEFHPGDLPITYSLVPAVSSTGSISPPEGITINSTTGEISGLPIEASEVLTGPGTPLSQFGWVVKITDRDGDEYHSHPVFATVARPITPTVSASWPDPIMVEVDTNNPTTYAPKVIELDDFWEDTDSDEISYSVEKKPADDGSVTDKFELSLLGSTLTITGNSRGNSMILVKAWGSNEHESTATVVETAVLVADRAPSLTGVTIDDVTLFPGFYTRVPKATRVIEDLDGDEVLMVASGGNTAINALYRGIPRVLGITAAPLVAEEEGDATVSVGDRRTITLKPSRGTGDYDHINTSFDVAIASENSQASEDTNPSFASGIETEYETGHSFITTFTWTLGEPLEKISHQMTNEEGDPLFHPGNLPIQYRLALVSEPGLLLPSWIATGIALDPDTGEISGTPSMLSTGTEMIYNQELPIPFYFQIIITDADGDEYITEAIGGGVLQGDIPLSDVETIYNLNFDGRDSWNRLTLLPDSFFLDFSSNSVHYFDRGPTDYTVSYDPEGIVSATLENGNLILAGISSGEAEVTITATDPDGVVATEQASFKVSVADRPPTQIAEPFDISVSAGNTVSVPLAQTISDPDGDKYRFEGSSPPSWLQISEGDGAITLAVDASANEGDTATVTVNPVDVSELSSSFDITVSESGNTPIVRLNPPSFFEIGEGTAQMVEVSMSEAQTADVNVVVRLRHTQTDSSDLTLVDAVSDVRTLTISAGMTSASVEIQASTDQVAEGSESFRLQLEAVDTPIVLDPTSTWLVMEVVDLSTMQQGGGGTTVTTMPTGGTSPTVPNGGGSQPAGGGSNDGSQANQPSGQDGSGIQNNSAGRGPISINGIIRIPSIPFTDTAGTTHAANIDRLAEDGITRGCNPPENSSFCPNRSVTRGEMATFMVRAFDLEATGSNLFSDDNGNTHESNINALAVAEITRGCNPPENTRYCPDRPVTRAQMATFLARAKELDAGSGQFADTADSPHNADINRISSAGITRGCNPPDNTRFCPERAVTRGEMATFLIRAEDIGSS